MGNSEITPTEGTETSDLQDLIDRLRVEKASWDRDDFEAGKARGRQFAYGADYPTFVRYAGDLDQRRRAFEILTHDLAPAAHGREAELSQPSSWYGSMPPAEEKLLADLLSKGSIRRQQMFRGGWIVGMAEVWAQVKDRVQAAG
jgi:hypothetical protein